MVTLTAPIVIPNVTRWRVSDCQLFDSAARAVVTISFRNAGQTRKLDFAIQIGNGGTAAEYTQTVIKNLTPTSFQDDVTLGPRLDVATAYDQIEAAYRSAGTKAAAFRAIEQKLIDLGIVSADLLGAVS